MKRRVVAIALIIAGVGATLVGLYGQIFLTGNEGHHDGRVPTFALDSERGADEILVGSNSPNEVEVELLRAGQPIELKPIHEALEHVFVVGAGLDFFEHIAVDDPGGPVTAEAPPGDVHLVIQASPTGGPDLLELGDTVTIEGDPFVPQNITDADEWTDGDVTLNRQGFDFVVSEPWNGDDLYGGPALLTLFRADDFAFGHAHAQVVGDNRFSFSVDLPGSGKYLASVEFEQNDRLVTALFRFTI